MATKNSLINTLTIPQRKLLMQYAKSCATDGSTKLGDFRSMLKYRDQAYQRMLDVTADQVASAKRACAGANRGIKDITVPIVMPQIESATAYQAGVFLTSHPIFGVISTPQNQDTALKFESLLADQSIKFGWVRELIKTFRDGYKYNFGAAVVDWSRIPVKNVVTDTTINAAGLAAIRETAYTGNKFLRIDPYNCFMDMTVAPSEICDRGEFFGWNTIMSRVELKQFISRLDPQKTTHLREAFESTFQGTSADSTDATVYHIPEINKFMNLGGMPLGTMNWGQWMGLPNSKEAGKIHYKNHYVVSRFLCRALPSDFGKDGNQVVVYNCIIINWQWCIFVEEMNVAHDYLPAFVMQPYEDGLGYQTQSMLDNALPFQDMSSALWNISLESKRRLVFDRLIYNPRLIDKKDIDPASSVARIPLRNAAIGATDQNPMQRAIYQVPYREDNSGTNIQMSEMIVQMADNAAGQNKVERGQFQKGNKTKTEFDTTMANSNSRQQLSSLVIEAQFMTPAKETIKANTLQFQTPGTILNREARQEMQIDPVQFRETLLEFKMTDGLLPADKMMNSELLMVFLQTAQALPAVATEYDVMGMFLYWAKLRGAYWLEDFKRNPAQQQQFLQTLGATQQAMNMQPPQQQQAVAAV